MFFIGLSSLSYFIKISVKYMSVRLLCSSNIKPIANWFLLYTIELKRILKASSDHKTILLLLAQLVVNQFRWNLAICLLFAFQFPVLFKNKKTTPMRVQNNSVNLKNLVTEKLRILLLKNRSFIFSSLIT